MGAIDNDWLERLAPEFRKPYYAQLYRKVSEEYARYQVALPEFVPENVLDTMIKKGIVKSAKQED